MAAVAIIAATVEMYNDPFETIFVESLHLSDVQEQ